MEQLDSMKYKYGIELLQEFYQTLNYQASLGKSFEFQSAYLLKEVLGLSNEDFLISTIGAPNGRLYINANLAKHLIFQGTYNKEILFRLLNEATNALEVINRPNTSIYGLRKKDVKALLSELKFQGITKESLAAFNKLKRDEEISELKAWGERSHLIVSEPS